MFRKLVSRENKETRKKEDAIREKMLDVIEAINNVCIEKKVTVYELMDIVATLQKQTNMQTAAILQENFNQIKSLTDDRSKPEEDNKRQD